MTSERKLDKIMNYHVLDKFLLGQNGEFSNIDSTSVGKRTPKSNYFLILM